MNFKFIAQVGIEERKSSVSVEDAMEELEFPSFFEMSERKAAFEYVMLWGTEPDKKRAEEAKQKYPFEEETFLV
jgi:hypothetical protein